MNMKSASLVVLATLAFLINPALRAQQPTSQQPSPQVALADAEKYIYSRTNGKFQLSVEGGQFALKDLSEDGYDYGDTYMGNVGSVTSFNIIPGRGISIWGSGLSEYDPSSDSTDSGMPHIDIFLEDSAQAPHIVNALKAAFAAARQIQAQKYSGDRY